MLLVDHQIRALCQSEEPMITPFSESTSGGGVISFGLTSAGYDLRLGEEVLLFKNTSGEPINPKMFGNPEYRRKMFDRLEVLISLQGVPGRCVILPPNSYALGTSVEYFRMPRWLKGRCTGKSTLARSGILINTTPLEPDWEGLLTLEIGNVTSCQALLFIGEGVAQVEFEKLDAVPEVSYKDKKGQYQGQTAVTPARVK